MPEVRLERPERPQKGRKALGKAVAHPVQRETDRPHVNLAHRIAQHAPQRSLISTSLGGVGLLSVDGKEVAKLAVPNSIPLSITVDETFDVGVDTRTGVDDRDYQPPFRFNGRIGKLSFRLIAPVTTKVETSVIERAAQAARNGAQ